MCELLEFMYQGVVNVKHTELQSFMKIGQLLQIKGLATNSNASPGSSASEKSAGGQMTNTAGDEPLNTSSSSTSTSNNQSNSNNNSGNGNNNSNNNKTDADHSDSKNSTQSSSRTSTASPSGCRVAGSDSNHLYTQSKRSAPADFSSDSLSIYSRKQMRRSLTEHPGGAGCSESGDNADNASMDNALNSEEFFLPPIPHISMVESRYDLGGLKREGDNHHSSLSAAGGGNASSSSTAVSSLRNPFTPAFNLDSYNNFYKASNSSAVSGSNSVSGLGAGNNNGSGLGVNVGPATEFPNELYMASDYSKNFANHMDIPSSRLRPCAVFISVTPLSALPHLYLLHALINFSYNYLIIHLVFVISSFWFTHNPHRIINSPCPATATNMSLKQGWKPGYK